ncbi:hypothetical protein Tco_0125458 [Tanacetum coccineum]
MAPKRRTTRLTPSATPTPVTYTHTTTSVTNAQLQGMIDKGIIVALAARDATRNGNDSHTSGTWTRRPITTPEATHAMPWRTLKKMMTDKYCPKGEMVKRDYTEGLNLCVPNVTITMRVLVLPNATSTTDLVMYFVTA